MERSTACGWHTARRVKFFIVGIICGMVFDRPGAKPLFMTLDITREKDGVHNRMQLRLKTGDVAAIHAIATDYLQRHGAVFNGPKLVQLPDEMKGKR